MLLPPRTVANVTIEVDDEIFMMICGWMYYDAQIKEICMCGILICVMFGYNLCYLSSTYTGQESLIEYISNSCT